MLPEKFLQVLAHEGVVAIASQSSDGRPHVVNTWNSYIHVQDERLFIPVGGMVRTEKNILENRNVLLTLGSREVQGKHGPGTGFLITATAEFVDDGPEFEIVKNRFAWARAALIVTIEKLEQTL